MKNYFLICFLPLLFSCGNRATKMRSPELPETGHRESLGLVSSQYVAARQVDVWLPPGYTPTRRYPVLYMHDGQLLFDAATTWNHQEWGVDEVLDSLIGAGIIPPCLVVGIWNGGSSRHADYFPQQPFESLPAAYRDSLLRAQRNPETALFSTHVQSDNYLKFVVEELKPQIDAQYATLSERAHTYVAGSSMGGLLSMYALCEYPTVFGGAACLSTHWTGIFSAENNPIPAAFMAYLRTHLPDPATHRLYFDYGTETLDALYEPFQLQADAILREKGYSAANWQTLKFVGADHSERAWQARLAIPLTFLMKQ